MSSGIPALTRFTDQCALHLSTVDNRSVKYRTRLYDKSEVLKILKQHGSVPPAVRGSFIHVLIY